LLGAAAITIIKEGGDNMKVELLFTAVVASSFSCTARRSLMLPSWARSNLLTRFQRRQTNVAIVAMAPTR
jgi:hypothetical protein